MGNLKEGGRDMGGTRLRNVEVATVAATPIEREYIEIYPVDWTPLDATTVANVFSTRSLDGLRELTLYLHIPFCPELCAFCGFNKTSFRETAYREYVDCLTQELRSYRSHPDLEGRTVNAIYVGGGTGSMLEPDDLDRLVAEIAAVFPVAAGCELTIESHPNTLDATKLGRYAAAGVNRLSIGVQSFVDRKLQAINRSNTAARNEEVYLEAKAAGIDKISIDLMYRLPHETMDELDHDLAKVAELRPTNVSCYSLIVEGTAFERVFPTLPDLQVETEMFVHLRETLTGVGYEQWSLADFCVPGGMTRYNLNYWRAPQTLLLGLGAGAHTHYFGGHTWANIYSVGGYMSAVRAGAFPGIAGQAVAREEVMRRYVVLGVHCLSVDCEPFRALFGHDLVDVFESELADLCRRGWLEVDGDTLRLTPTGELYINNVGQRFFSDACRGQGQPWSKGLRRRRPDTLVSLPG